MYDTAYHLNSDPFRLSPDHRFCFRHKSYTRNKAYLDYALQRGEGFVMITGAPGSGKTTLLNDVLSNAEKTHRVTARIVTTQLAAVDLLRMVAFAFKLNTEGLDKATLLQHLEKFLVNQNHVHHKALLVIDEAQDLEITALEEIRLLTNLQDNYHPLLQVFLVGQDNLQDIIESPKMEQLHQRMIASSHLDPMSIDETAIYVIHRLRTAGWKHDPLISRGALRRIHIFSRGVPRRINQLCSRFLLYGAVENKHKLDSHDVQEVINELRHEHLSPLTGDDPPVSSVEEIGLALEMETINKFDQEFLDSSGVNHGPGYEDIPHNILPAPAESTTSASNIFASANIVHITSTMSNVDKTTADIVTPPDSLITAYTIPDTVDEAAQTLFSPVNTDFNQPAKDFGSQYAEIQQTTLKTEQVLPENNRNPRYHLIGGTLIALLLSLILWASPDEQQVQPESTPGKNIIQNKPADNSTGQPEWYWTKNLNSVQQDIENSLAAQSLNFEKTTQGIIKLQPDADVQFSRNSAVMSPDLQSELVYLARAIKGQPQAVIHIIGHCDNTGSHELNNALSSLRAGVVADFLFSQGIPRHRLTTEGRGTDELVSKTDPQLNRRVELLVETL